MSKQKDLTGQTFGRLTTVRESPERLRNEVAYICKCECGNEAIAARGQLLNGRKKSCGCLRKESPSNVVDMINKKFGKLKVIERAGKTKNDNALWLCECDCGNSFVANGTSLRRGDVVSCGCDADKQISNARKVLNEEKSVDGVQIPLLTKKVRSDSKTGYKGVAKRIRNDKVTYEVSISVKGKRYYLGTYDKLKDAIQARKEGEKKYHQPYIDKLKNKEGN